MAFLLNQSYQSNLRGPTKMDVSSLLTEKCKSLFIFEIAGTEYCLSNASISSISKPSDLTYLRSSDILKHPMILIDDKTITLVDLKCVFKNEKLEVDENSRIIIMEYKDIQFGILVEKIKEIIAVDPNFMDTSLKFIQESSVNYIEGIVEFEERELLFLNIPQIVSDIVIV